MSKKLDLYLEKIIAKMNLDDAQREGVEREFRAHLEEAVREGVEKGLTEEQAETEAILAFGQPSVIARQFGITHGYGWFVFEKISQGLLIFFLGGYILRLLEKMTLTDLPDSTMAFLICLYFVSSQLWNKIEVNGTFRIQRLFFRTRNIPFDLIEKVSFGGRTLLGSKRIYLFYKGGKVDFSSPMRNFRCAALALDALCPHALEPEVSSFLARIRLKIRKEGKGFRTGMTLYWLTLIILFSFFMFPLWKLKDCSTLIFPSFFLFFPGVIFQIIYQQDRAKKGILSFITVIYLLYFGLVIVYGFLFTNTTTFRWLSLGFYLFCGINLLSLWWQGKRLHYIKLTALFLLIFISLRFVISSPNWNNCSEMFMKKPFSTFKYMWFDPETMYATTILKGKYRSELILWRKNNIETLDLEQYGDKQWWIHQINGKREAILTYNPYYPEGNKDNKESAKIFRYSKESGLEEIDKMPDNMQLFLIQSLDLSLCSPDNHYILTPLICEGSNGYDLKRQYLAFTNIESGKVVGYEGFGLGPLSGWIDDETYEVIYQKYTKEEDIVKETKIKIRHFHLDMGENELVKDFVLQGEVEILKWSRKAYAPIVFIQQNKFGFIDLNTGLIDEKQYKTHPYSPGNFIYSWNESTGKFAFISREENKEYLNILQDNNLIKKFSLISKRETTLLKFSPDGSKIFMTNINDVRDNFPLFPQCPQKLPLIHYYVADLERDKIGAIEKLPVMRSIYQYVFIIPLGKVMHPTMFISWTPDSRSVVYQINNWIRDNGKWQNIIEFHMAKYEDFAEKNL